MGIRRCNNLARNKGDDIKLNYVCIGCPHHLAFILLVRLEGVGRYNLTYIMVPGGYRKALDSASILVAFIIS